MHEPISHENDEEAQGLLRNQNKDQTPKAPAKKKSFGWVNSIVIVLVTLLMLAGILVIAYENSTHYAAKTEDLIRPLTDQRQYQNFFLSNGLDVLAISDPEATSSTVALSVQVGSFANPPTMKGLAHFVEHLLFLGSDKYPELNSFPTYISSSGGSYNAYTSSEETNFHFKVSKSNFEPALDMFLHMFIDPIFTREWAGNEVSAVDGEYNIDLQKDVWKVLFALQLASNPKSPFAKFSIGNTQTLIEQPEAAGIDIVEMIKNYFNTYYSSNLMSLVVLDNANIEEIQNLVKKQFSLIDDKQAQQPTYNQFPKPFSDGYSKLLVQLLPVGDDKTVYIIFCTDSSVPYPKNNPLDYIYTLLNYGGQGSLSSILTKKGWILDFTAGSEARQSSFELVRVAMTLTDEGIANIPEITKIILAYLDLIKQQGLTQDLFNQFATIAKYKFDYDQYADESHDTLDEVRSIASNMRNYPIKYALAGSNDGMLYKFNPDLTARFLDQLKLDNLVIVVANPEFDVSEPKDYNVLIQEKVTYLGKQDQTSTASQNQAQTQSQDQTSTASQNQAQTQSQDTNQDEDEEGNSLLDFSELNRYDDLYKLNYSMNQFSYNFVEFLSTAAFNSYPELKLPVKNTYIPANFAIAGSDCTGAACAKALANDKTNSVKTILENANTIVRYLTDRSFGAPLTTAYIRLNSAKLQTDPKYIATSGIIGELIKLVLTEELYEISSAGHSATFMPRLIKLEAFSEKFSQVTQTILQQYKSINYDEPTFNSAKGNFASNLNQNLLSNSYTLALDLQKKILLGRTYTSLDIKNAADALTYQDFSTVLKDLESSAQIETFLYGNLLESDANSYGSNIVSLLGYQPYDDSQLVKEAVVNIQGKNLVYRMQSPTLKGSLCVTLNYYQDNVVNIKDITTLKILTKILDPEATKYLRTQKKLGYIANLVDDLTKNVMGLKVIVVSSSFNTNQVDLEIENLWKIAENVLSTLTDDALKNIVNAYAEGLTYNSKSYRIKGNYLYSHISNEDYIFDLKEKMLGQLPNVKKQDLIDRFEAIVKQPKKLSIQLYSQDQPVMADTLLLSASSEYSNTAPSLLKDQKDLSTYPKYSTDTVLSS